MKNKELVLGGGCFWCLEAAFKLLPGVVSVIPGYSGGHMENPSYGEVCGGDTNHAEVVKVSYKPDMLGIEKLLGLFFSIHDPTSLNRQGADAGSQYRSVVFYADKEEKQAAEQALLEQAKLYAKPIVTEIAKLEKFWPAEEEHIDYYNKNPNQGYCSFIIRPKLEKAKRFLAAN